MNATGQQMSGGAKYGSSTRIGNWYEEISLSEAKVADFKKRSDSGSLNLRKLKSKISKCTQTVPHTFSTDGMVRFGDAMMLANCDTGNVLACDPFEDQDIGMSRFLVSTSLDSAPMARNVFTVTRPPASLVNLGDDPDDPVLRFGQAFMLKCDNSLLGDSNSTMLSPPLYLSSIKKTEVTCTKETNRQMVFMSPNGDSDAVFNVSRPSFGRIGATERFLAEGTPVTLDDLCLLVHRNTNTCITTDPKKSESTMFGVEFECFADRTSAFGKIGLISAEFNGQCTSKTLSKPDGSIYFWNFVASSDSNEATDNRELPPAVSKELLLKQMKNFAVGRGVEGWLGLRAQMAFTDRNSRIGDGKIDREDIKECITRWGVGLEETYLDSIVDSFDKGDGILNYRNFLSALRGDDVSPARTGLLESMFAEIAGTDAAIPLEVFMKFLNPEGHPLAFFGGFSAADVQAHIVDAFTTNAGTHISQAAFVDYFSDIAAVLDDDEYFEGTIRSVLQL
jgi:Ca2+-binding EF-hand superfamily protein